MPKKSEKVSNPKLQRLFKIANQINKEYDSNIIKFASDEPDKEKIGFGHLKIDEFTGGGSIKGNYIIVWGPSGTGKSTLMQMQIAEAQKKGLVCAYIDLEHSFDKSRAAMFGVNLKELFLVEDIDYAEQAMDVTIRLAVDRAVDIIIIDSIQAMSVKGENEGKGGKARSMEEAEMALLATKMSKFLRRTSTPIYKANIAVSLVGQARTGGIGGFAPRLELSGGHMLRHMSMLTIQMRRGQGTDAPSEMVDTGEVDEKGKIIKVRQKVGFDCVLEIEKTKTNSKPEGSRIHVPYLFASGYAQ